MRSASKNRNAAVVIAVGLVMLLVMLLLQMTRRTPKSSPIDPFDAPMTTAALDPPVYAFGSDTYATGTVAMPQKSFSLGGGASTGPTPKQKLDQNGGSAPRPRPSQGC